MIRKGAIALAAVLAAISAGCGTNSNPGDDDSAKQDDVQLTQGGDVTVAMVTHGDGGSFWAVAKRGAEDAAKQEGVTLKYSESNNDAQTQAQMIEAAITEKVDGLAVSAPDPDAIRGAVEKAVSAGISVITLNSGADSFQDLGAITHVGQTEEIAGEGAGAKLKEAGVKKLICVIHEQSNLGLNQRCDGATQGFGADVETLQVKGTADISTTLTEIQSKLQADKEIDGVLALNPDIAVAARDAVKGAGSSAKVATFDLSGDVVQSIEDDTILFAVDQQQYLQGYLPVVFLALNKRNLNTVGGGQPVLTGPGFVTKENAGTVAQLAQDGTR